MRCLYGKSDDLHAYAVRVAALADLSTLHACSFGGVETSVVHRDGLFQTELIRMAPGEVIPVHRHPGIDSIDLLVSGDIAIEINGAVIAGDYSPERRAAFLAGKGLRIDQTAFHGGRVGPEGVTFLSCQRWNVAPSHIGLCWEGPLYSDIQKRLLEVAA